VLTSRSDLSQVKVTRRNAATGKMETWVIDCRQPQPGQTADLWLRAGDVVEVPEKP
jgi:hypothetical protein